MKKSIFAFVLILVFVLGSFADERVTQIRRAAEADLATLSRLPLNARVGTSDYDVVPRLFSWVMFIDDTDAPFLYVNDIQLSVGVSDFEITDYTHIEEGREVTDFTTVEYSLDFLVVNPEFYPADLDLFNMFIHDGNALYSTPAFAFVEMEDFAEILALSDRKQMISGFSGGFGLGLGGIGLSCLITALIVDDYRGMFVTSGLLIGGAGAGAVWFCNSLNDGVNREMQEVYDRMAAGINAGL